MLDIDTLRISQVVVGACVFALVYVGTYRPTRAPYAAWWSLAVLLSGAASSVYFLESTVGRPANAIGHALSVLGAACAWGAAASLRRRSPRWWSLAAGPAIVLIWTLADASGLAIPSGTLGLLLGMSAYAGLASWEVLRVVRELRLAPGPAESDGVISALVAMAAASGLVSVFYGLRALTTVAPLDDESALNGWAGPRTTTLVVLVLLVVVTYSITELSHLEMAREWRDRATSDGLTGLLLRVPFHERGDLLLARAHSAGREAVLVVADLDHFKRLNDDHGHAEGDRALRAFGATCRATLREDDLACRLGGEEFALLLAPASAEDARRVCARITAEFQDAYHPGTRTAPTVSYGLAVAGPAESLDALLLRADAALYEAKRQGRDRAVLDELSQ